MYNIVGEIPLPPTQADLRLIFFSHKHVFQRLCEFLFKVQTYSDSNRMDLNNLAIVFSPTILKNNSGNLDLEMRDMQKLKKVTEVCQFLSAYVQSHELRIFA